MLSRRQRAIRQASGIVLSGTFLPEHYMEMSRDAIHRFLEDNVNEDYEGNTGEDLDIEIKALSEHLLDFEEAERCRPKPLQGTYDLVDDWNTRANNELHPVGSEEYWDAIRLQFSLVCEELEELKYEFTSRNLEFLTKELCDVDIVVQGLIRAVQSNHKDAIIEVTKNNDEKIYWHYVLAMRALKEYQVRRPELEVGLSRTFKNGALHFTVKNKDGKVIKAINQTKADITQFAPVIKEVL